MSETPPPASATVADRATAVTVEPAVMSVLRIVLRALPCVGIRVSRFENDPRADLLCAATGLQRDHRSTRVRLHLARPANCANMRPMRRRTRQLGAGLLGARSLGARLLGARWLRTGSLGPT